MDADDASSAEMRRLPANPDADQLALDEDTVERLLTGTLPPAQAPAGYAELAQLLAAAVAAPTPEELAVQEVVLAELRAVTRGRLPAVRPSRRARTSRRRRRAGLAVVVVVGALVGGGVAGAATGHLPGPVREAARTMMGTAGGGTPAASTQAGQPPAPVKRPAGSGGGLSGARPGVSTGPGADAAGAGPAAAPNLEGLCQAVMSGNGAELSGKLDATAFEVLARAAGGKAKIDAYCRALVQEDQMSGKPKGPKDTKQPKDPEQPEQPVPSGSGGQGQSDPPADGEHAP